MATNPQGLTTEEMGGLAEKQMQDRVVTQSMTNPNTLVTGGSTPAGQFQAMTQTENPALVEGQAWLAEQAKRAQQDQEAIANRRAELAKLDKTSPTAPPVGSSPYQNTDTPVPKDAATLTADVGAADAQAMDTGLSSRERDLEIEKQQRINDLREQQKQEEDYIRQTFSARKSELGDQQGEQQATQDVLAYRLGRKDTPYGVSEMSKLKNDQARVMNELTTEENRLVLQSRAALKKGEFDVAQQMRDEADRMLQRKIQQEELNFRKQSQIMEEQKYAREYGKDVFSALAEDGKEPSQELYDWYDETIGVKGIGESIFSATTAERKRKDIKDAAEAQKADVDIAKSVMSVLKDVPVGTTIRIGDAEYTGLDRGEIKTATETDNDGNVTFVSYNDQTGEIKKTSLGAIGKKQDGWETMIDDSGNPWRINAKTGQQLPFYPSRTQEEIQQELPEGSVSPFVGANGEPRTQCGEFANDCTNIGVGDSFDSKMQKMNLWKRGEGDPETIAENLQVGDVFTQKLNTWTGHVGMVLGVEKSPSGVLGIRALESNYVPGKVTSTRFIPLSQVDGFGRGTALHPILKTGPDTVNRNAAPTQAFGNPTFGGKKSNQPLSLSDLAEVNKTLSDDKKLQIGATQSDAAAAGYTPGAEPQTEQRLSDKQRKEISVSAEKKALDSGRELTNALTRYRELVDKYGFETFGANKTALESAYADLKIKYKEAAGLGALTGPDIGILEEAIKPATGKSGLGAKFFAGGNEGIIKGIDDTLRAVQRGMVTKYDELATRFDKYTADEYLKQVGKGVMIRVKDKQTGQTGTLPLEDMDATKYERL